MSKVNLPFNRAAKAKPATPNPAPTEDAEKFISGSLMASRVAEFSPTGTAPSLEDESIYRTVNVKLNRRRYSKFKLLSAVTEKPMQQYMVELIDELLERHAERLKKL